MQREFFRPAGDAHAWLDELPKWAEFGPVGHVIGHWRWRGEAPASAGRRVAAWGYRAGFGGRGEFGLLGGRFEPHDYPFLTVSVGTALDLGARGQGHFRAARVGLPLEYVGGVLAGALHEPDLLGPGTLTLDHAAAHEVDSSWEVFRLLAVGLVRLVGTPLNEAIPADLLPRFGGPTPPSPGTD